METSHVPALAFNWLITNRYPTFDFTLRYCSGRCIITSNQAAIEQLRDYLVQTTTKKESRGISITHKGNNVSQINIPVYLPLEVD